MKRIGIEALYRKPNTSKPAPAKRMVRKLKAVRQDMLHRMHAPVREQHRWLGQTLRGHYRYYGVIFNYRALRPVEGMLTRYNKKTVTVITDDGRQWNVSPAFLSKAVPSNSKNSGGSNVGLRGKC